MSAGSNQRSEDQFLCCICLDVFTDPVSTPCGHNFCKSCITQHWDVNVLYKCPMCKEAFHSRPQLKVNTFIREMVDQFSHEAQQKASSSSEQQAAKPGEVLWDVGTGTKLKALKSCLVCLVCLVCRVVVFLAYYCWTLLKPVELMKEMILAKIELKKLQQYAVYVTLDPDTAHPNLVLSDDRKQVHHGDVRKKVWYLWDLPDNPERFSDCVNVLGSQSFSSGRFYFEVQVKGKTKWVLGVARESINRKGEITLIPRDGYWTVWLRNGNEYIAAASPSVRLHLQSYPEKVGVFVDYEEGLVSFYDVDAAALIHSFTGCSFTEKLYPFFSPSLNYGGKNSAPLIISPVKKRVLWFF